MFGPAATPAAMPEPMRSTAVNHTEFLEGYDDNNVMLRQGSYGIVSQHRCRWTGKLRAIKAQTLHYTRDMTAWLREEKTLEAATQSLNPDASCVVRLIASCLCPFNAHSFRSYLVLEHCEMSLEMALQQSVGKPLPETLRWTSNLFCGLSFIHSINTLHGDIKPSNTLLAETGTGTWDLKIVDFGQNRAPAPLMTTDVVTLQYRAPEILMGAATQQARPLEIQQHNSIELSSTTASS